MKILSSIANQKDLLLYKVHISLILCTNSCEGLIVIPSCENTADLI